MPAYLGSLFRLPTKLRRRARRSRMLTLLLLFLLLIFLIYPFYAIYKPPRFIIRWLKHRWPEVLWEVDVPKGMKVVALTIDDAPSEYSHEILELLQAHDAKATFFIIGSQIPGRGEAILHDLVAAKMELGNHAMRDEPSRSLPIATLRGQIKDVQDRIDETYHSAHINPPTNRFFRPGSGFFNRDILDLTKSLGLRVALGSVYPHDPQIPYAGVNARHILSMVRPGSVIICHDRRSWTVPMLKKVVPELRRRGYEIVTLSELVSRGIKR